MKSILVATDNSLKFEEIAQMARIHGCKASQIPADFEVLPGALPACDAIVREQTILRSLPGGRVEHESSLQALFADGSEPYLAVERVRGSLDASRPARPGAYHWDCQFIPSGGSMTLDELKMRGLKVSARQRVVGSWLQSWLEYSEPVAWAHMEPQESVELWLSQQPILLLPQTAPTREIVQRVARGGAWFKDSGNRRVKHYWWPGLNAGIPMTPKRDYCHELTFLVHDIIHWAMPDAPPATSSPMDFRLYVVARMMSEAITLVMADMAFIDQALSSGLAYDSAKRRIHPLYRNDRPLKDWCLAMSHYAIRGDDSRLAELASSPSALAAFEQKYAPFFEADLRWTAHNGAHLQNMADARWLGLHGEFKKGCDLGLSTTQDYWPAWSENDAQLVDNVFEQLWARHWETAEPAYGDKAQPEQRRLQRWWLGQLALTFKMDDMALSACVRKAIVDACLGGASSAELEALIPLWDNYIDALEALSRISSNDAAIFKVHYPVTPPLYVSYDLDAKSYVGIPAMWAKARGPAPQP